MTSDRINHALNEAEVQVKLIDHAGIGAQGYLARLAFWLMKALILAIQDLK
jgi:hypothetical protein